MHTFHSLNILVHLSAGIVALGLGLFPLLSVKGSRFHRISGWLFVVAGVFVIGCAIVGITFFPQPVPLMVVTMSASYQFIAGLRSLPRFGPGLNLFDAFLALSVLAGCALIAVSMNHGSRSWSPAIGYGTMAFLIPVALYDLSRHFWASPWRRSVRLIDHGLKMTGAYFAMASAGLGNLARGWQPWSQFGPSILGLFVMGLLLTLFIREKGRKANSGESRIDPAQAK
jgi:hypothetical protein